MRSGPRFAVALLYAGALEAIVGFLGGLIFTLVTGETPDQVLEMLQKHRGVTVLVGLSALAVLSAVSYGLAPRTPVGSSIRKARDRVAKRLARFLGRWDWTSARSYSRVEQVDAAILDAKLRQYLRTSSRIYLQLFSGFSLARDSPEAGFFIDELKRLPVGEISRKRIVVRLTSADRPDYDELVAKCVHKSWAGHAPAKVPSAEHYRLICNGALSELSALKENGFRIRFLVDKRRPAWRIYLFDEAAYVASYGDFSGHPTHVIEFRRGGTGGGPSLYDGFLELFE